MFSMCNILISLLSFFYQPALRLLIHRGQFFNICSSPIDVGATILSDGKLCQLNMHSTTPDDVDLNFLDSSDGSDLSETSASSDDNDLQQGIVPHGIPVFIVPGITFQISSTLPTDIPVNLQLAFMSLESMSKV